MRRLCLFAGCAALLAATGCATVQSEEREASEHARLADEAAARRDYQTAALEQRKAEEHRIRAADKASVEQPPPVVTPPPPAPPY